MAMRRVRLAFAVVAVLAAGCSKEAPPPPKPAPQVSVVTVTPQTIPYVMTYVAQTESSRQVDIVARVSGYLERIAYKEGELVQEGQLLFELDPKPFRAQLDAAKGELRAQQARLSTAKANLSRIRPLAKMDAVSRADLDKAQGEHDSANAAVFAARAKVKEQELNLGYTTIESPVTGLASRSSQRQGAYINAQSESAKLTYVAALDPVWVNFSVSQNQTTKLRDMVEKKLLVPPPNLDFEVEVALSDGTVYPHKGRINFADPSFSQETGSFLVRAVLPNPDRQLRPGMFVTARLYGDPAQRDRRAAARRAAGLQRPPGLRRQARRRRRDPPGGGGRLPGREGHRHHGRVAGRRAGDRGRRAAGRRRPAGEARRANQEVAQCLRTSSLTARSSRRSSRS
jgi:membrane fusion protein (multidrug efflux system)